MKKLSEIVKDNVKANSYNTETIEDVKTYILKKSALGTQIFSIYFDKGFNFDHIVNYLLSEGFDVRIELPVNNKGIGNLVCWPSKSVEGVVLQKDELCYG